MIFLQQPNLPQSEVTRALVSAALPPDMRDALARRGVACISLPPCPSLVPPVASHPDLALFYVGDGRIVVCPELFSTANSLDFSKVVCGEISLSKEYPADIAYDALLFGGLLVCNERYTDSAVLSSVRERDVRVVNVRQGYAKCSVCIVAQNAAITEDRGIALALRANGVKTLLIPHGGVRLDGYDCGFIGGASGLISPSLLVFCGDISAHAQYEEIRNFCDAFGVEICSLSNAPLTDYGSILPLSSKNV